MISVAPAKLYRRLLPYLAREKALLAGAVVSLVALSLATLGRPWPMTLIVDNVLSGRPLPAWLMAALREAPGRVELLVWCVTAMVVVLFVAQTLALAQTYLAQLLGQRLVFALRCDIYAKIQNMSLKFHDNGNLGDMIYRITGDAAALKDIVTYGLLPIVINAITIILVSAAIVAMDFRLAAIVLVTMPLLLFNTIWFSRRVKGSSRGLARADSSLYTKVSEVLGSIRAVKAFGAEELELERFAADARRSQHAYVRIITLSTLGGLVNDGLAGLATAVVVLIGALIVMGGALTVGELLVFVAYLGALQAAVTATAQAALVVHRSYASAERVVEVLEQDDERSASGRISPAHPKGRLTFEGVSFAYEGLEGENRGAVITELDLEVKPGEIVAFVGRSGAGKTTLLSLVMGFYRPQSGRVLFDGFDIRELDLKWLRGNIALVLQDAIIFSASLAENIEYGRRGASRAEIEAAAKAAGLHDFIAELPESYDTQVGERGARLSGGQRQRIGIARAFLKDAPVLVLDEPTSNLDATTEQQVFESLERLAKGRTTLIVAHRLATARRADRIVVMEAGRILEQGAHDELLAKGGAYADLWRTQGPAGPRISLAASRG